MPTWVKGPRLAVRQCASCESDFQPWRRDQRFCGRDCAVVAKIAAAKNPPLPEIACATCETTVQPRTINQRFCSRRCKIRSQDIRTRYGLTMAGYRARLAAQDNCCAACGDEFADNETPVLDHCHTTGRLRGFLHVRCNCGIGHARDDQETLFGWQVHLARHSFDLRDICIPVGSASA